MLQRSTERRRRRWTSALIAGVAAALCSACNPFTIAGKASGAAIGKRVAERASASVKKAAIAAVDPRGGDFCPVMGALGWPPPITDDRLNAPLAGATVGALEHGEKHCGWKP